MAESNQENQSSEGTTQQENSSDTAQAEVQSSESNSSEASPASSTEPQWFISTIGDRREAEK
jgi:hypothetical protein